MKRIYLDYAATTPVHPLVAEAMAPFISGDLFGNPSSIYSYGCEARQAVEHARFQVAGLIGATEIEIVFTSGGTESDNLAIIGTALAREKKGRHIVTSSIEHHAIEETCKFLEKRGWEITFLPVDGYGMVDPVDVEKGINSKTVLISIMHANNEIGTIQPMAEIGKIARQAGVCLHTDAVQTTGHIPINVDELGVDLLSMSSHKLYGPKGVGALYIRKGTRIMPYMHGGGQEHNKRSGTENVPGIVGFGKAVALAAEEMQTESARIALLRTRLIQGIFSRIEHVRLNGHPQARLPNNVNISVEFIEGESMMLNLDMEGICTSTGSACSSGSLEPSHTLLATGLTHELAHGSLRLTLGKWTTQQEVDTVLDVLPKTVERLRAMSPMCKN